MSRRSLLMFVFILLAGITTKAQDFATRYMAENAQDSTLNCISVSPKMMEEILHSGIEKDDSNGIADIISKLKSMQIITADKRSRIHFKQAEDMAQKNSARFKKMASYDEGKDRCRIFIREQKEQIVELILLRLAGKQFTVINFTGDMNEEFIDQLTHTMMSPRLNDNKN